jgi:hypothetical protein
MDKKKAISIYGNILGSPMPKAISIYFKQNIIQIFLAIQVVGRPKNFTDIMKHYRNQPQASSHVYRSVLLRRKDVSKESSQAGAANANQKVI